MLIKWANENDLPAWYSLATEVSGIFQHPSDMGTELRSRNGGTGTVGRHEMITAVDYMSGTNMGFICFSSAYDGNMDTHLRTGGSIRCTCISNVG